MTSCFRGCSPIRPKASACWLACSLLTGSFRRLPARPRSWLRRAKRNRLARELHDSVSQVIFSIRLTAESARILLEREPARVPEQVDLLQTMTGDALARLRSLIAELRPPQSS